MQTENQIKADAVNEFVSSIIGARESGLFGRSTLALDELHRTAQYHVQDRYGVQLPDLVEQWGEEVAKLCSIMPDEVKDESL